MKVYEKQNKIPEELILNRENDIRRDNTKGVQTQYKTKNQINKQQTL